MLKQLVLTVLCVAISTTAYAEGWIMWQQFTYFLDMGKHSIYTKEQDSHGFSKLTTCKAEALARVKDLDNSYRSFKNSKKYEVSKFDPEMAWVTLNANNKPWIRQTWVCFPSSYTPENVSE